MIRLARGWSLEGLVFLLLLPTFAWFYQSSEHNEAARFDQIRALLEDGTLHVDRWARNTADVVSVERDGGRHVYPNKAPGATLLAFGPAALWAWLLEAREEPTRWHAVAWLTTLTAVSLPAALAAVATCRLLRRRTRSRSAAAAATLALWLGAPLLPFSTLFFSHGLAAALVGLTFCLLAAVRGAGLPGATRLAGYAGAGLLLGLGVTTEYPVAVLGATLAIGALPAALKGRGAPWTVLALVLGGLAGLVPLLLYNLAAFGDPLFIPYEAHATSASPFPVYQRGFLGIAWPGLAAFARAVTALLFDPQIGLVHAHLESGWVYATSPVLLLAGAGLVVALRRHGSRHTAAGILVAVAAHVAFNATYGTGVYDWGGGGAFGPRHLVPMLPLLALPLAYGARRSPLAFTLLFVPSVFYMLLGTAVQPRVPISVLSAARDLHLPQYLEGELAVGRGELFDAERRPLVGDATAWNVGGVLGLAGAWQLAPLMAWWALMGSLLVAACRDAEPAAPSRRLARAAAVLVVLLPAAIAMAPSIAAAVRVPASGVGLIGHWYATPDWTGSPRVRVDPEIDFDWTTSDQPRFSAEWCGSLHITRRGGYWFALTSDDGSFLWIGDRLIIDNGGDHASRRLAAYDVLKPGRHPVRVRYFNALGGGLVRWHWTRPGLTEQLVPPEVLFPEACPALGPAG